MEGSPAPRRGGTLFVVATPLGNLQDMSPRALDALRRARAVYCEDTRRTRVLMSHFGLSAPLLRYREEDARGAQNAVRRLEAGEDLALACDAGTPGLSDPGRRLVAAARRRGLPVCPIPGPSALAAALSASGLPADSFVFLGFLPRSSSRRRRALREAAALGRTLALYESPFRVAELLADAEAELGPSAQAVLARELSKVHEEWLHGPLGELRARLAARGPLLGECVVLLHPGAAPPEPGDAA